jgi:hypothetical protein
MAPNAGRALIRPILRRLHEAWGPDMTRSGFNTTARAATRRRSRSHVPPANIGTPIAPIALPAEARAGTSRRSQRRARPRRRRA